MNCNDFKDAIIIINIILLFNPFEIKLFPNSKKDERKGYLFLYVIKFPPFSKHSKSNERKLCVFFVVNDVMYSAKQIEK